MDDAKASRLHVACFITPHGFGHTTRACAIMSALRTRVPALHFDVFSLVPPALLAESLGDGFTFHACRTDVGLVQRTDLCEDLDASADALDGMYPLDPTALQALADTLRQLGCRWVLCDIAPLGLRVAELAGLQSVLIENFTWDWVYEGYAETAPRVAAHAPYLRELFARASLRITTVPACELTPGAVQVPTISRAPRLDRASVRDALGVSQDEPLLLFNLGYATACEAIATWPPGVARIRMVVTGPASGTVNAQLICVPSHGRFFHPDLVNACDGVVGKLGYSTVAEVYHAGVPLAYLSRSMFRESGPLQTFVDRTMPSLSLGQDAFEVLRWRACLAEFLDLSRVDRSEPNGADIVADLILSQPERFPCGSRRGG